MRNEWKPEESSLISAFISYQEVLGKNICLNKEHVDSPEFVVSIDGKIIGCEITEVTDFEFRKKQNFVDKNTKPGEKSIIEIDFRPELWIKKSILSKQCNRKKYLERSGASELWLF